jgi:hypothetical protein
MTIELFMERIKKDFFIKGNMNIEWGSNDIKNVGRVYFDDLFYLFFTISPFRLDIIKSLEDPYGIYGEICYSKMLGDMENFITYEEYEQVKQIINDIPKVKQYIRGLKIDKIKEKL